MRSQLRRRFYARVDIAAHVDGFGLALDDRPVRTPARRILAVPTRGLAQALAAEWEAQREVVDPAKMPLTRLANSIIDGVAQSAAPVAAEVEKYLASDLVFYRAERPDRLVARQAQAWDPVLAWARDALGAEFVPVQGMVFVAQPAAAVRSACAAIPRDAWQLGAVHAITTLTGSALIALAFAGGALSVAQAWAAAHVDEDWNMEFWGQDQLALDRRAARFAEMQAAATVLRLAQAA
jgi:chaperone required for assembly of F1-ATPase